jgi:hypothetical protein
LERHCNLNKRNYGERERKRVLNRLDECGGRRRLSGNSVEFNPSFV